MQHIQGEERNQLKMYCLEQMIAPDSFVRAIDFFVDAIDLASFGFKNITLKEEGRPPYHPSVLLKLYFYGYRYGIRSSRKLEREAQLNLEVRWLLCEQVPSARTICSFRKEYSEAFRNIFRRFVFMLKELGLIEGKTIAIDSFKVRAQNSLKNNYNQKKIDRQLEYIDGRINEFEDALDKADSGEEKTKLTQKIETQKTRREKYQSIESELKETGKDQISTTDQDAQSVVLQRGITVVGYNVQGAVDSKHKLITHFDTGGVNDTNALADVAIAVKQVLKVEEMDVLADKGYKSAYKFQRYNTKKCKSCELQPQCTKSKTNGRNIDRSEFADDVIQNNRRVKENSAYYKQRQQLAEHPWGTLKRQRGFDHVLTRGKKNVLGEVSLVFIGYNLSRFIQITEGINAFKELIRGIIALFFLKRTSLKPI